MTSSISHQKWAFINEMKWSRIVQMALKKSSENTADENSRIDLSKFRNILKANLNWFAIRQGIKLRMQQNDGMY